MTRTENLALITSWDLECRFLEQLIKSKAVDGMPLHILEAGCGNGWEINLGGIEHYLTGVDLDKAALEIRKNSLNDLYETIEGDLCSLDLGGRQFDIVYNAFVLEHVKEAEILLANLADWTKPNGLIILKIPDPYSVNGFFTRITPYWLHVMYYRIVVRSPNAGKPGYAPYPTCYHPIVSRQGIQRFCRDRNLEIKSEFGDGYCWPDQGLWYYLMNVFKKTVNLLSFGALSCRHANLLYVIQKHADEQPPP